MTKEIVKIGVKLYTNNFPLVPWETVATSDEVTSFLLSDCGCAFTQNGIGTQVHGDKNIWYLGLAEKFGLMQYKDQTWKFGFGEANFDLVKDFIDTMFNDGFLNDHQLTLLLDAIEEGRKIPMLTAIGDYIREEK